MADVVFVIVVIGFFALAAGMILGCDRIVRGGDDSAPPSASTEVRP